VRRDRLILLALITLTLGAIHEVPKVRPANGSRVYSMEVGPEPASVVDASGMICCRFSPGVGMERSQGSAGAGMWNTLEWLWLLLLISSRGMSPRCGRVVACRGIVTNETAKLSDRYFRQAKNMRLVVKIQSALCLVSTITMCSCHVLTIQQQLGALLQRAFCSTGCSK
jgi:hypothetical protein